MNGANSGDVELVVKAGAAAGQQQLDQKAIPVLAAKEKSTWESYLVFLCKQPGYSVAIEEKFIIEAQVTDAAKSYNSVPPPFFMNEGWKMDVGMPQKYDYMRLMELFKHANAEVVIKSKLIAWEQLKALETPHIKFLLDNWDIWGKGLLEKNWISLAEFSRIPKEFLLNINRKKLEEIPRLKEHFSFDNIIKLQFMPPPVLQVPVVSGCSVQ
jgi:hypothetical protein